MADTTNPALQTVKPQAGEVVYLVATGEVADGRETYTRHDTMPPLSEAEILYTRFAAPAQAAIDAREQEAHRDYRADFDTRARRLLEKARGANPLDGQAVMTRDLERLCEFYLALAQPAPVQPKRGCELGCEASCKAKEHGCASECPALPWQPAAPVQQEAAALRNLLNHEGAEDCQECAIGQSKAWATAKRIAALTPPAVAAPAQAAKGGEQ